ncbi:Phage spanin Rz LysB [Pseudomonas chlororaphis subsp. aureofaciens]|uniref:Rz-like lysis system protein LysB n=1 Tax=Pseudomonas chlororaphis TaxID=587753 RepID=UPI000F56C527|nr:Rz-like lysis system protein LysB [Pseudomonas chlororaphis]AZD84760.1 Phage spanin Rz LysB [Pseudomonas chlororaphis subsp. aureofaciens]
MSTLRQALLGIALVGVLGLLLWVQQLRVDNAVTAAGQAKDDARTARDDARSSQANANTLQQALVNERDAQAQLRVQQDQLRQGLAKRERTIEELKRENSELRDWAAQQLPDAARRLRERPAFTGASAYRQWLSGRGPMPPASDKPKQ